MITAQTFQHQLTRERHNTDIMTRRGLYRHNIPFSELQMIDILIDPLPGVLEMHLHKIVIEHIGRYILQPVPRSKLAAYI
jgi:hypothetical protein